MVSGKVSLFKPTLRDVKNKRLEVFKPSPRGVHVNAVNK